VPLVAAAREAGMRIDVRAQLLIGLPPVVWSVRDRNMT